LRIAVIGVQNFKEAKPLADYFYRRSGAVSKVPVLYL